MRFAKWVFRIAGVYGLLVVTPVYFLEGRIARDTPPAITHPEYFYGFLGLTLTWQVLFLLLSLDPVRYRILMLPTMLEKVSYGITLAALFALGRVPLPMVLIGAPDWIWFLLFLAAYRKTATAERC